MLEDMYYCACGREPVLGQFLSLPAGNLPRHAQFTTSAQCKAKGASRAGDHPPAHNW